MGKDTIGIAFQIPLKMHADFMQALINSRKDNGEIPSIKEVMMDFIMLYTEAAKNVKQREDQGNSKKGG